MNKSYGAMDQYLKARDSDPQGDDVSDKGRTKEDESEDSLREEQFALHQVIDTQHGGVVAWIFEHPATWLATSGLVWSFQDVSYPIRSYATVKPFLLTDQLRQLSVSFKFPGPLFFWVEPNFGHCQQGQDVLGACCMPPMSAADAITRYTSSLDYFTKPTKNVKIVSVAPIPPLAPKIGLDLKGLPSEDVCLKIEYQDNGQTIGEEIYGIKVTQVVPYYGPMGVTNQTNWGFALILHFKGVKGSLDKENDTFWRIACSFKINPLWDKLQTQTWQQLQTQFNQYIQMGYSQIQAASQLSRSITANNDALLNAFEQQRQAARQSSRSSSNSPSDRSPSDAFSEYIRGVETCDDPYYGESQQDYNYNYHWTDGFGNYQHSNDPFFNPNIGSTQNWTYMEPKKK